MNNYPFSLNKQMDSDLLLCSNTMILTMCKSALRFLDCLLFAGPFAMTDIVFRPIHPMHSAEQTFQKDGSHFHHITTCDRRLSYTVEHHAGDVARPCLL